MDHQNLEPVFYEKLKQYKSDGTTWKPVAEHTIHVTDNLGRYGMVLGRDVLQSPGIDLDLKENNITWDDYQADMKSSDFTLAKYLANVEVTKTISK
eukprot:14399590-Ditylum_brightwellii.AAC.1